MEKEGIFLGFVFVILILLSFSVSAFAPLFTDVPENRYVCEGQPFREIVKVKSNSELELAYDLSPKNPFFIKPEEVDAEKGEQTALVYSKNLTKAEVGKHDMRISVAEGGLSDEQDFNVEVIEINNYPTLTDVGVQTVDIAKEKVYLKQFFSRDVEDGTQDDGNLVFRVLFSNQDLFDIQDDGFIEYFPREADLGLHRVQVCVLDRGIKNINKKISFCGQTGNPVEVCDDFELVVVKNNKPPTITDSNPRQKNLTINGDQEERFDISVVDPEGAIPDIAWYVDGVLEKKVSGKNELYFTHKFECEINGRHNVKVVITDGLANDSVQWGYKVTGQNCTVPPSPGTGKLCDNFWGCGDWDVCQNAARSLESGVLTEEDYNYLTGECAKEGLGQDTCGFQIRQCVDTKECGNDGGRPDEIKACRFDLNPSCSDNIRNCHSGACEFLVDCGGPCDACATCSDGKENQGEEWIDCGGPCDAVCSEREKAIDKILNSKISMFVGIAVGLFLLILMVIKFIRVSKIKKDLEENFENK